MTFIFGIRAMRMTDIRFANLAFDLSVSDFCALRY